MLTWNTRTHTHTFIHIHTGTHTPRITWGCIKWTTSMTIMWGQDWGWSCACRLMMTELLDRLCIYICVCVFLSLSGFYGNAKYVKDAADLAAKRSWNGCQQRSIIAPQTRFIDISRRHLFTDKTPAPPSLPPAPLCLLLLLLRFAKSQRMNLFWNATAAESERHIKSYYKIMLIR